LTHTVVEERCKPLECVDKLVVNLWAFFDDAGTGPDSNVVACAGYLALDGRWDAFSSKWRHLLRSYHVPDSKFSMKRYAHFKPPFDGWDELKRRSFMAQALALIKRYVEVGFVCVMRKSDYDGYLSEGVKNRAGGYFSLCAQMCVGLVEAYVAKRANRTVPDQPTEYIDYVFERGSVGAGHVHAAFEEWFGGMDRLWYREFRQETKDSSELHAADVLAYETCKLLRDVLDGKTYVRHPFRTLIAGIPHMIFGPDGSDLAKMDKILRNQGWIA